MKKLSLTFYLLGLVTLLAISTVEAQEVQKRKAVKDYVKNTILPKLSEARNALDKDLSEEDKGTLEILRTKIRNDREENKAFLRQLRELKKNGEPLTDEQKIKWADIHLAKEEIHKTVREIAKNNEEALKTQLEMLKPYRETWKEDLKELVGDGFEPSDRPREQDAPSHNRKGNRSAFGKIKRLTKPVGFLLWDGSIEQATFDREGIEGVMAYPNPSSGETNIMFRLTEADNVNVALVDSQGEVLKTLFEGTKPSGEHTLSFSTNTLESGIYFYKITTSKGVQTKRFVVRR